MKKIIIVYLAALSLQIGPVFAGPAIEPYTKKGKSGVFLYAVYNDGWLRGRASFNIVPGHRSGLTPAAAPRRRLFPTVDATPVDPSGLHSTKRIAITGLAPGTKGNIVIPESLDGFTVYGIDENAFRSVVEVHSITIPKTVRFMRAGTLNRCKGLKEIIVAADHPIVTSVDGMMFTKDKTQLLAVGSGSGPLVKVPDTTTVLGESAFAGCTELEQVTIPAGVIDIGGRKGRSFEGCVKLQSVKIPDTVVNIGQFSFKGCSSLRQVTIPPKITKISFGLFRGCKSLKTVILPDGITSIDNYAFAFCSRMKMERFPKSLTTIGAMAFFQCNSLKDLRVPESVTSIGNNAFLRSGVKLPGTKDK